MSAPSVPLIEYPDSDGRPMADNTLQYRYIVTIQGGFDALYRDDPLVFVAGDVLWYPVEGHPEVRTAPDVLIAFGRPKGDRGSYRQWEEGNVAPQVVWEVLSPGNRPGEMADKRAFYLKYGAQEYYEYDPDNGTLQIWLRRGDAFEEVADTQDFVSPLTGVRLELRGTELVVYRSDGARFLSYLELDAEFRHAREAARRERLAREVAERQAEVALRERQAAEARADVALRERQAAEAKADVALRERQAAEARAELEQAQRRQAEERAARLAERLRQLGIDPDA
jgi:Uma2 family endonuclease